MCLKPSLIQIHPQLYNIGVIDVETCEPVPNVLIDIWQANATGHYSGHPVPAPELVNEIPIQSGKRKGLLSPFPKSEFGATFLRGAWPTNTNGVASFTSIFPGYYTGRATRECSRPHTLSFHLTHFRTYYVTISDLHVKVHPEWTVLENGTYSGSRLVHVGQLFFDDELNMNVDKLWPYNLNPITEIRGRTRNWDDSLNIFEDSQIGGYKSVFETYLLGGVLQQGIVGYITMVSHSARTRVYYPNAYAHIIYRL